MKHALILAFASALALGPGAFGQPPALSPASQENGVQPAAHHEKKRAKKGTKQDIGPGHEAARGGGDIGKGVGRGSKSMAKGAARSAGDLATAHPVKAGASLGKGAAGLGKDSGEGAAKGIAKVGKGAGGGLKKLGRKIFR